MITHIGISVRGALAQTDAQLKPWIGNIMCDGVACKSVGEVRSYLMEALSQGYEYIGPPECDNWDPKRGCLGHDKRNT